MSLLTNKERGHVVALEAEHLVGRSPRAALQLDDDRVSSQHANLYWDYTASTWLIRDLGSRNGTVLNGRALKSGESVSLNEGDTIGFGSSTDLWLFSRNIPPQTCLVPIPPGDPLVIDGGLIALPDTDNPLATVYSGDPGEWFVEHDGTTESISDGSIVEVAERRWRFQLPQVQVRTRAVPITRESLSLKTTHFNFAVSGDEESVHLRATANDEVVDLGDRVHNYLLLTLARLRAQATADGVAEKDCGWVFQDTLCDMLKCELGQLNLMVFRLRRLLDKARFADAVAIIERRTSTKELRIGIAADQVSIS